jgi:hypothetical protein
VAVIACEPTLSAVVEYCAAPEATVTGVPIAVEPS